MDALYQQILDRLAGELNPQVFEDCACDLLRDIYSSLVPVRGGRDAGMDGAIADGEAEAFPLICTTRQDFRRNFRESLDSSLKHGRRPGKVVFATSQEVTPEKRRLLEGDARERDFTLIQAIDRHGFAQRLYGNPRWLKDLLDLSATPPALSAFPLSRRPLLDLEPIGRDEDLYWLRSTPGDLILAGEPGSGKTFLFVHLIRGGWDGVFLVDHDRGKIKSALLERRPAVVIVDDAHLHPEILGVLRHLRQEMEADFSLIATTWTWDIDLGAVAAELPGAQTRKLRLLPRHQILEIYQQAGIQEPDSLLRELVDQAANKPGLAATIAHLWKRGAWQEILEGKALHKEILAAFGGASVKKVRVEDLLAAFSLGGDTGMDLETVQEFLGLNRSELRVITAALAAGGVLSEEKGGAVSVWPQRLRTSLLRTVFFPDSVPGYPYRDLLVKAPSFGAAVLEIALVRQAGARVPEIHDLVLKAGFKEESAQTAWYWLAAAGQEEARWVLEHYPGDLLDIASSLLERIPSEMIPRLLGRAEQEALARERESRSMHLLSTWVQKPYPDAVEEPVLRRKLVAMAAKRFLEGGGNLGIGAQAIGLALKPNQQGSGRDPGLGNTVKYWSALLPLEALRQISQLWGKIKVAISSLDRTALQHLETALWDWMHPSYAVRGVAVSEEVAHEMRAFALQVLQDLIPLAQTSPGLGARLARLAAQLDASLPVELDSEFDLLYPEDYVETEPARKAARQNALLELSDRWERLGPEEMARHLAEYEAEAERIGYSWPRGTQDVCRFLAERVDDPLPWLDALIERGLESTFVSPFLTRLVREHRDGWEQVVDRCLDLDRYEFAAIDALLMFPNTPRPLVGKVLGRAPAWAVEGLALRRELPPETLRAALLHPNWKLALAAAVGEWLAGNEKGVRAEFRADWRTAVLRARDEGPQQHWLELILARDPDLALEWLRTRLQDPNLPEYFRAGPFASAVQSLQPAQRAQLLGELPAVSILSSLLPRLVERDVKLYRQLLARPELQAYHLYPLSGKPDEGWRNLALLALEAGHSPEEIARATFWGRGVVPGPGFGYSQAWEQTFESLEDHPRAEMREVGRYGQQIVEEQLQRARAQEEQISLHGL